MQNDDTWTWAEDLATTGKIRVGALKARFDIISASADLENPRMECKCVIRVNCATRKRWFSCREEFVSFTLQRYLREAILNDP